MKRCMHEDRLTPFLLGDLPDLEAAEFRQHLAHCPVCQKLARELEPVLTTLRTALAKDATTAPQLDASRHEKLLAVQPRQPWLGYVINRRKHIIHWAMQPKPWLRVAACLLVGVGFVSIVILGLVSSFGSTRGAKFDGPDDYCVVRPPPPAPELDKLSEEESAIGCADGVRVSSLSQEKTEIFNNLATEMPKSIDYSYDLADVSDARAQCDSFASTAPVAAAAPAPTVSIVGYATLGKDKSAPGDLSFKRDRPIVREERKAEAMDAIHEAQQSLAEAANAPGEGIGHFGRGDPNLADKGFEMGPVVKGRLVSKGLYASRTADGRVGTRDRWGAGGGDDGAVADMEKRQDGDVKDKMVSVAGCVQSVSDNKKTSSGMRAELAAATPPPCAAPVASWAKPMSCTTPVAGVDFVSYVETASSADVSRAPKLPRAKAHSLNPFVVTADNKFSTFGIDVSTASYTLTRAALRAGRLPDPDVVRTEAIINSFDFGDIAPEKAMFRIYLEGAPSPFGEPGLTLLRIGVKGKHFGREEQRASVLTFLIDTSGSMAQPDRIGRARLALRLLLDQLAPADRVQIVAFDNHSRVVLGPTPATEKAKILAAFDHLQCNGSTNLEDGMRQAYQQAAHAFVPGAENRILLISDGVANLGSDNAQDILKQIEKFRHQGISFSVYGVGQGSYDDAMLQDLANKGDGVYRFLDSDEEVRRAFVDDLAATLNTIATDVKIQVEWSPDAVKRYRQLGYESRALTAEQFRDDSVTAGGVGSGQAVTAMYELDLTPGIKRAPLGVVHVRYRRADTHVVEEIEQPITAECIAASIQKTRSQFRLAVSAAAFAEMLRGSQYVSGQKYSDVAQMLRPVALDLSLDQRVKELLSLVENADALSR